MSRNCTFQIIESDSKFMESRSCDNYMFHGHIPKLVPDVLALELSNNQFSGNIPSSMGNMRCLFHLDLSGNAITGNIPWSLGNCSSMEFLNLRNNDLAGSLPSSLSNLGDLT
ncbi:hypothetical protein AMTRI_Chr02g221350 [Amborella trichopoda]